MTGLRSHLRDYLRIRRQLGFELKKEGRQLERFVGFVERAGGERITTELALAWARLPADAHPQRWRARLGIVRGFARYVAMIDPSSEVPSEDLLPAHRQRVPPYVYPPVEIAALIEAARTLTPSLRAASVATVIGLMATTGVRVGEALGLARQDVDLSDGALHIRAARPQKQREVPLHASATVALRRYARVRDRDWPRPETPAFFLGAHGRRLTDRSFNRAFCKLIRQTGLEGRGARCRPRPHDLRHTFAVATLLDWFAAAEDVDRKLPLLSTYLGHVDPASTYWYLEAAPELLALVSGRLERASEVLS